MAYVIDNPLSTSEWRDMVDRNTNLLNVTLEIYYLDFDGSTSNWLYTIAPLLFMVESDGHEFVDDVELVTLVEIHGEYIVTEFIVKFYDSYMEDDPNA